MKDAPVIAIDLGGTNIKSALVSPEGKLLKRAGVTTQAHSLRENVLTNIFEAIESVLDPAVTAIGMGSPGCVNPASGAVNWIQNIECLNGFNLKQAISEKFKLPFYIDNDANCAALGEYYFGAGKGARSLLVITLGTGVGGGILADGQILQGAINYAGEIGHMTYIPDGMACSCGKRGCLEAYASASAIIRSARSVHKRGLNSALTGLNPDSLDARIVCDLAREGDEVARSIVQDAGKAIGVVTGGVINLLGLDRVVLGGGVAAAGDILLDQVKLYAARHALPMAFQQCEILTSTLGNDAGLLGAAGLARFI